jgi:hypothetical protein
LWQHEGASAPKASFHDQHALEPDTQYEYCVSARNEFGEVFGPIVTIRTGKRLADARAAYETAAKPDDVAAVRAIWDRLAAGGHVRSLRSLDLLAAGLHAEGGPAYIPVRAADRADRSDLKVPGAVQRDTSGDRFTGTARLTAPEGLLPRQGPMTLLFALAWDEPPTDPRGVLIMHPGAHALHGRHLPSRRCRIVPPAVCCGGEPRAGCGRTESRSRDPRRIPTVRWYTRQPSA